jgi:hypothetical protein
VKYHIPALVSPAALKSVGPPPIQLMIDGLENLCATYVGTWHKLPRYCYMNTDLWNEVGNDLQDSIQIYNLEVVDHPAIPWGRICVHSDYIDPRRIAYEQSKIEDEDSGIARGQIAVM